MPVCGIISEMLLDSDRKSLILPTSSAESKAKLGRAQLDLPPLI